MSEFTNPIAITPERLEYLEGLSAEVLTAMVETGEIPEFLNDAVPLDEALGELAGLWDKHKLALANAGSDYVFSLLHTLAKPEVDLANFEETVSTLSDAELIELSGLAADEAEAQKLKLIDARADLIADIHGTLSSLAKAAFATAMGAALGLPPVSL